MFFKQDILIQINQNICINTTFEIDPITYQNHTNKKAPTFL